jgi:lysophospholipase L1-like esterase
MKLILFFTLVFAFVSNSFAAPITIQILCEGDSRIEGNTGIGYKVVAPADTFPSKLAALIGANSSRYNTVISSNPANTVLVKNIGLGGTTSAQHLADKRTQIDPYFNPRMIQNIVISAATINDFNSGANPGWTVRGIYNARKAIYDDLVAGGWEVYVGTIITTTNGTPSPTLEAIKSVNNLLRANIPANRLIDWAADSQLADPDNTTYFQADKLHLKPAGNQAMARVAYAKIRLRNR